MIKKISYVISQRFQWLFIATFIVMHGVFALVSIVQQLGSPNNPWTRPSTALVLLALNVLPVVVAILAALLCREHGIVRKAFFGSVIGHAWALIWAIVIMNLPGLYSSPEYFSNGLAAIVAATVFVALAMALDRWWQPTGVYRTWRTVAMGAVMGAAAVMPVYNSALSGSWRQVILAVVIGVAFVVVTLVLFRRLIWADRVKRLVLLALLMSMVGSFASYVVMMVTQRNVARLWYVDLIFMAMVYVIGAWLLWPKMAHDSIEQ